MANTGEQEIVAIAATEDVMANTGIEGIVASFSDEKIATICPLDKVRFVTTNADWCII